MHPAWVLTKGVLPALHQSLDLVVTALAGFGAFFEGLPCTVDTFELEELGEFDVSHGTILPVERETDIVLCRTGCRPRQAEGHLENEKSPRFDEIVEIPELLEVASWAHWVVVSPKSVVLEATEAHDHIELDWVG